MVIWGCYLGKSFGGVTWGGHLGWSPGVVISGGHLGVVISGGHLGWSTWVVIWGSRVKNGKIEIFSVFSDVVPYISCGDRLLFLM